jgi:hypothetical protein
LYLSSFSLEKETPIYVQCKNLIIFETRVLGYSPFLRFHMPGLATCSNTPNKEMSKGEGETEGLTGCRHTVGRCKVSASAHFWGIDMSSRFK